MKMKKYVYSLRQLSSVWHTYGASQSLVNYSSINDIGMAENSWRRYITKTDRCICIYKFVVFEPGTDYRGSQ